MVLFNPPLDWYPARKANGVPAIQVTGMTDLVDVQSEMDVGKLCKDCLVAHRLWRNTPEISSTEVLIDYRNPGNLDHAVGIVKPLHLDKSDRRKIFPECFTVDGS